MAYELWDRETANLVGDYPSQGAALAKVRQTMDQYGRRAVESLALAFEDEDGKTRPIAAGVTLVELAEATAVEPPDEAGPRLTA